MWTVAVSTEGFFLFFLFFLMLFRNKNEKEKPQIQPSPVSTRRVGRLKVVIWYLQYRCGLVVINQWMTNPKLHQNSWSWHCQLCVSSNVNSNNNKLKKWSAPYPKSCCYLLWRCEIFLSLSEENLINHFWTHIILFPRLDSYRLWLQPGSCETRLLWCGDVTQGEGEARSSRRSFQGL